MNFNQDNQVNLNLPDRVLVGYWFQWLTTPEEGTAFHTWPEEIPLEYNMIVVAFMHPGQDGIPTFSPDPNFLGEQGFLNAMNLWKSQGREVLISLGGAAEHYELRMDQKQAFKAEMQRIVDHYGFTGIDLSLQNTSIAAGANDIVIPEVLNELKSEFNAAGRKFFITMAPEFPYLRPAGVGGITYLPYIDNTNYDLIMPQYYNQSDEGVAIDTPPWWISNSNVDLREDFIYYITMAIASGEGFFYIPAEKMAIGFPATPNAAYGTPRGVYYTDPAVIIAAMNRLRYSGIDLRGVMTWSINQDKQDIGFGPFDFGRRVGAYLGLPKSDMEQTPTAPALIFQINSVIPSNPSSEGLNPPSNLFVTGQTDSTISLAWNASNNPINIEYYEIFRDGIQIAEVSSQGPLIYTDIGLTPGTTYNYTIRPQVIIGHSNTATGLTDSINVTTAELMTPVNLSIPPVNLSSPPVNLRVTSTSININWDEPTSIHSIVGYRIYRNNVMIGQVTPDVTYFVDSGLLPDMNYTYAIATIDEFNNETRSHTMTVSITIN